jgi:acetaldehyde dehydrogenase
MRDAVYAALAGEVDREAIRTAVERRAGEVAEYVPGYRLKSEVLFDEGEWRTPGGTASTHVTVLLEVAGAGDYLPVYAGNLDIMTAAAVQVGERLATQSRSPRAVPWLVVWERSGTGGHVVCP